MKQKKLVSITVAGLVLLLLIGCTSNATNTKTEEYTMTDNISNKILDRNVFEQVNIFGTGIANTAYAEFFIGESYLNPLALGGAISNITFEPGCRNDWHIHHADEGGGQILLCTAGEGWYQEEGKPPISLKPGSVIEIPVGVKHWHGAKADSWFSHIAFGLPGENVSNEWLEPVEDEQYNSL